MHANAALFRRMVETWSSGDREGAAGFFAEDVVIHYPGPGPLHGDHRGRDGIIRFWAEQDRLTGGSFRPEFLGLAADDHRVYLLVRFEAADASISFHRAEHAAGPSRTARTSTGWSARPVDVAAVPDT